MTIFEDKVDARMKSHSFFRTILDKLTWIWIVHDTHNLYHISWLQVKLLVESVDKITSAS